MKHVLIFLLLGLVSASLFAQTNAPTKLAGTAPAYNQINLTWKANTTNEAKFEIERKDFAAFTKIGEAAAKDTTYQDKTVQGGGSYTYRVRAILPTGAGTAYSNEITVSTPPTPPTTPTNLAASVQGDNLIRVTWTNPGGGTATEFLLERGSTSGGSFSQIAVVPYSRTPMYDDRSVYSGTQYCYRVRAVNAVGPSGYTDVQCATTPAPPVGAPTNLVATAVATTQINLTWTGVTGASSYQLERSPNGTDSWTKIADPAGSATSYEDKSLAPNTRYYYRLRAVLSNIAVVFGPYSNVANAQTPDAPPIAPARLTATAVAYNQINLQWADLSNNETGFQVERSPNGTDGWTKIADVGQNGTTYSDQSVQPQTQYFYRVRAVNAAGPSAYSDPANATTPVGPPAMPQNLVATAVSTTQINLTWTAVATATNVLVERSPNGTDTWNQIADLPGTATTYEDKNLSQNTRYYYRIRAKNGSGTGPYSNVANAMTPDAPPAAPARLTATAVSFSQINLTWADGSNNESGFELERSPDGTTWTKIADLPANTTTYEDKNLKPRTRYVYRIRAVNAAGPSPYANSAEATTPDSPPAAPSQLKATAVSNSQINLTWVDGSDNETGFELERSPDGNAWTKIADLPANTTTYSNTGLTPNTRYVYRIRAVNAVGQSAYSNVADETTPDVPPAAPARLTATAVSTSQINLQWADLSNNERGFEVERGSSATGAFTKIADLPANATTYEDKNLTDATPYCYRVRAVNAAGPSPYTDPACATTPLAPPAAPTNLTAKVFDYDQIQLNWTALGPKAVTVVIERATSPNGPFTEIKQQPAAQNSYLDMGLQEFTTYYYRIKATNTAGMSGYSNVASARVEEVIIAVEDELETHTTLLVNERRLHVITNWFRTLQTTVQLYTANGQTVLTDSRKVYPADRWTYPLDTLPTGVYILNIVADGRKLAKRILLP